MEASTKFCNKCQTINFFSKNKNSYDGLQAICKTCAKYFRELNRDKLIKYFKDNREEFKKHEKRYYEKNKLVVIKRSTEWAAKNPVRRKEIHKKRDINRKDNERYKIDHRMGQLIYISLKRNKPHKHWKKFLDYTLNDLRKHLASKFTENMTWFNMGEWHLDHIKPKSLFSYTTHEDTQFKECWSLENLQPLWAIDNLKKSASYNPIENY